MNKKLVLLIAFILILAFFPLRARWQLENSHQNVEIIMDSREFQEIMFADSEISWDTLAQRGVTGASLPAFTLEDLVEMGKAARWSPAELQGNQSEIISEITREDLEIKAGGAVFFFPPPTNNLLNPDILSAWENLYGVHSFAHDMGEIVYFPSWHEDLEDLMPGYDKNLRDQITEAGLRPAARLKNQPDFELNKILLEQAANLNLETVIFTGDEVAGYPANITETARVMGENDIIYGFIEPFLADQEGANQLARGYGENVVRLHSMQREEMEQGSLTDIKNRYLRSVQERNVRYLYLRGVPAAESFSERGEKQKQLAGMIATDLQAEGFSLQSATPLQAEFAGERTILLATFLVIFAGFLFLKKITALFSHRPFKFLWGLLFLSGGGLILFYFSIDLLFYRQLLALTTAIIFPALSGFYLADVMLEKGKILSGLLSAAVITLGGGLLVAVILSTDLFFNQIYVFRGVKIAFLLPLIITGTYYFLREIFEQDQQNLQKLVDKFWHQPLLWKHLVLAFVAGVFLLIYIGRTGNLPFIPVPAWEIALRNSLEELLAVRPRFKEFLIGHPFLFLLPLIKAKISLPIFKLAAVLLAVIGQITIINSFSHLHTPLAVTLLRTLHGYWLALPVALVIGIIIWSAEKFIAGESSGFFTKDEY